MATPIPDMATASPAAAHRVAKVRSALARLHRTDPDGTFIQNLKIEGQLLIHILRYPSNVVANNLIRFLCLASHFSELYLRVDGADAAATQQQERFEVLYWAMVIREACGGDLQAHVNLMAVKQVRNFVRGLVDGECPAVDEAVETGCRF